MADVKYPDSIPVDDPVVKDYKPPVAGSGIRVDGKPLPTPKVVKKASGGHVHHSEHYGKHAAGYKLHEDHVKAMCSGGYMKGKK